MTEPLARYKPGTYYFRKAYRDARTVEERAELFSAVCREIEQLREWCRQNGMIPPKFELTESEIADKPWLIEFIAPGAQAEFQFASEDQPAPHCGQIELFPDEGQ